MSVTIILKKYLVVRYIFVINIVLLHSFFVRHTVPVGVVLRMRTGHYLEKKISPPHIQRFLEARNIAQGKNDHGDVCNVN